MAYPGGYMAVANQGDLKQVTWGEFMRVVNQRNVLYVGATERPIAERIGEHRREKEELRSCSVIYAPVTNMKDAENQALATRPPLNELHTSGMEAKPGFVYAFLQGDLKQVTWEEFMGFANGGSVLLYVGATERLQERIGEHRREKEELRSCLVIYVPVPSMRDAENQALATRPPLNELHTSGMEAKPGFVYAFLQ